MQIDQFSHIEGSNFLMDCEELNIRRIAAVNDGLYYRQFVYVETNADPETGLYKWDETMIEEIVRSSGYVTEEYGLIDGKLPITRAEYDDGAAMLYGKPVVKRACQTTRSPYNPI